MTVADLLGRMTSAEYAEWMALANLEAEERKRADLARRATEGLQGRRRKR